MGDFSNYAEQGMQFGQLVPYEVTELRNSDGSHPIIDVEHLGSMNATLMEEAIALTKAEDKPPPPKGVRAVTAENIEQVIKHCVRHLRNAYFSDGAQATDEDIPGFVRAMPAKAFARLLHFVVEESNFCKFPIAEKPAAIAEK